MKEICTLGFCHSAFMAALLQIPASRCPLRNNHFASSKRRCKVHWAEGLSLHGKVRGIVKGGGSKNFNTTKKGKAGGSQ